jgi:hypothetical protein
MEAKKLESETPLSFEVETAELLRVALVQLQSNEITIRCLINLIKKMEYRGLK